MPDNYIKTLIFNTTYIPTLQNDLDTENPIENAEAEADMIDILDKIGTDQFRNVYLESMKSVRELSLDKQALFCVDILNRIEDVYNFEFHRKIYPYSKLDINNVYKLVEFIEFKHLLFLYKLLSGLIIDLRKIDLRFFYESKWKEIQTRILNIEASELVKEFLRTNNKENLINFLIRITEKERVEITCVLMMKNIEGEKKNV